MPPESPTAVIIRNPVSRRAPTVRRLWEAAVPLRAAGWEITLRTTTEPGEAATLAAAAAAEGASVVVACGGDGTVNGVVDGLAGTGTALAVLPAGTADVWAREVFVPRKDAAAALALVAGGRRVRVDLGVARIGDGPPRRFLLMCGAGLDASVVRAVEADPLRKRRLGRAAFGLPAVAALRLAHSTPTRIRYGGADVEEALLLAVAGNTRLYGGVTRLASAARADDGLLDLVTFAEPPGEGVRRRLNHAALVARALRGGLDGARVPGLAYRRASHIDVMPAAPLPLQVDGEYLGECTPDAPLHLTVEPLALEVIVSRRANPLFGA